MKLTTFFLVLLLTIFTFMVSYSEVPKMINYQGKLTDSSGNLLNGTYSMEFAIYDDSTTPDLEWIDYDTIVVQNGIFSVLLGSKNPIPDSVFDGGVKYIGIKVNGDSEMSPRKAIVSVGYAYRSEYADTAEYANVAVSDGDWTIDGDDIYRLNGNVGIGTTIPAKKLHVDGSVIVNDTLFSTYISSNSPLLLQTEGTTRMCIDDVSGDVGIGITNPTSRLYIKGTNPFLTIDNASPNTNAGIYLREDGGAYMGKFWYDGIGDGVLKIETFPEDRDIYMNPGDGGVGIGTTTPDEKFEVEWVSGGTDVEIGRGTTNTNVTFITLRSPNGTKWYVFPNDAGVLIVTPVHP